MTVKSLKITRPDDWHVHLREGDLLKAVINHSIRVNQRCIVMPNLNDPITTTLKGIDYIKKINLLSNNNFTPLLPCYLTEDLNLIDFSKGLDENIFIGAKLYPSEATTNSKYGISSTEKIYPALEILEKKDKILLIHGEKVDSEIDIFDIEKYYIDQELSRIRKKFPNLRIVLEHISSKYGAEYVNYSQNIAGTITPHHMMLTKKDVFFDQSINPHHFCMPVVKNEEDLIALRNFATSGNKKFFLGTDSAPHPIEFKVPNLKSKPGIFSAPCSIEIYATIFDEEKSLDNLEKFCSINGPTFYKLPVNADQIELIEERWTVPEYTIHQEIKIKNFMGGKELNWKLKA